MYKNKPTNICSVSETSSKKIPHAVNFIKSRRSLVLVRLRLFISSQLSRWRNERGSRSGGSTSPGPSGLSRLYHMPPSSNSPRSLVRTKNFVGSDPNSRSQFHNFSLAYKHASVPAGTHLSGSLEYVEGSDCRPANACHLDLLSRCQTFIAAPTTASLLEHGVWRTCYAGDALPASSSVAGLDVGEAAIMRNKGREGGLGSKNAAVLLSRFLFYVP